MATILEIVAALLWIAVDIYMIHAVHHIKKGCDKVISDMAADIERSRKELWP